MVHIGTGFGTKTFSISNPVFAPDRIYTYDRDSLTLNYFSAVTFASQKQVSVAEAFWGFAEVPGMRMFLYKPGNALVKEYRWIDMELNVVLATNLSDPTLSGLTNILLNVDRRLPFMAVFDGGRTDGFKFGTIKIDGVCFPNCGVAGCSAWPTITSQSCTDCVSGLTLDPSNNCVT